MEHIFTEQELLAITPRKFQEIGGRFTTTANIFRSLPIYGNFLRRFIYAIKNSREWEMNLSHMGPYALHKVHGGSLMQFQAVSPAWPFLQIFRKGWNDYERVMHFKKHKAFIGDKANFEEWFFPEASNFYQMGYHARSLEN